MCFIDKEGDRRILNDWENWIRQFFKTQKKKEGKKKHISIKEPSPSFGLNANYVYRVFNKSISIKSHYFRASLTFLLRFRTRKFREQSEFSLSPIIFREMDGGFVFFSFFLFHKKKNAAVIL